MDSGSGKMIDPLDKDTYLDSINKAPNWKDNISYRDGYKIMRIIVNLQSLVAITLAATLYFFVMTIKDNDRYYAQTIDGVNIQMRALYSPNMSRNALANWVSRAVVQVMTFGFNNIDERFDLSKKKFTTKGWEAFRKIAIKSKLIDNVIDSQQLVTAVPSSVPILVKEGLMEGKYKWVFEMKILLTFRSGGEKQNNVKNLRIIIEKMNTSENPVGIGISEWYMY